jgi:hypothetical protein
VPEEEVAPAELDDESYGRSIEAFQKGSGSRTEHEQVVKVSSRVC